jgi:glycosyltransferase involved in cell wall biosynthesis
MRLLYFHQHFSTREGSTGTRSYEFARRLVARGHQVTMVCGSAATGKTGLSGPFDDGIRRGRVDGIDVIEVEVPYSNRLGFVRRALAFLRFAFRSTRIALSEACDVVFATSTPLTAALPGIAAARLRGRRFVFEVRDLWPELPKAMGVIRNPIVLGAMSVLEWLAYRSATACVALSPGIAEGIRRRSGPSTPVHVIPNGCDNDLFGTAAAAPWRPEQVAPTDLLAIFPGAHGMANGLDAVLDAAKVLLKRARNDIKILLVGDGMMKPHLVQSEGRGNLERGVPRSRDQDEARWPDAIGGSRPDDVAERPRVLPRHVAEQVLRFHRSRKAGVEQLSRLARRYDFHPPLRPRRSARRPGGLCRRIGIRVGESGRGCPHGAGGAATGQGGVRSGSSCEPILQRPRKRRYGGA